MSLFGGAVGVAVTAEFAVTRELTPVLPAAAVGGGPAVALLVGTVAGLLPAIRAARLSPVEALC